LLQYALQFAAHFAGSAACAGNEHITAALTAIAIINFIWAHLWFEVQEHHSGIVTARSAMITARHPAVAELRLAEGIQVCGRT
jgi:hypothetical protein